MKKMTRVAAPILVLSTMIALQLTANAAEDSRVTYYKNQVHLNAEQLRIRSKDLVSWQKNHWVAPRVCNVSEISWLKVPEGKTAALYDCAPFQCAAEGVCKQECSTDANCAAGARCLDTDASGRNGVCAAGKETK